MYGWYHWHGTLGSQGVDITHVHTSSDRLWSNLQCALQGELVRFGAFAACAAGGQITACDQKREFGSRAAPVGHAMVGSAAVVALVALAAAAQWWHARGLRPLAFNALCQVVDSGLYVSPIHC